MRCIGEGTGRGLTAFAGIDPVAVMTVAALEFWSGLFVFGTTPIYAPFSILSWSKRWSAHYPRAFAAPMMDGVSWW